MIETVRIEILGIDRVQVVPPPGCDAEARALYGEPVGLEERRKLAELWIGTNP